MKPKHKVVTRSPHRSVGLVPCSWLQSAPIEYESQLEYRFIKKLLLTPGVTKITSQPFQVFYGENGSYSYTPDFLVNLKDGRVLVIEVKPFKFIEKQRSVFDAVDKILKLNSLTFCIVTEQEIDNADSSEEIGIILRYAKSAITNSSVDAVKYLFNGKEEASFTIDEVSRLAKIPKTEVLHLLSQKVLFFESDINTSGNTRVKIKNQETSHEHICISNWLDSTTWCTNPRIYENDQPNRSAVRRRNNTPSLHLAHIENTERHLKK